MRKLIIGLLVTSFAVPLVGCNDDNDPGFTHTTVSTDVPTREVRSDSLPSAAATLPPTPRRETPTQPAEIDVVNHPVEIIDRVERFQTISFDISGFSTSDTLTIEGTVSSSHGGTDWKVEITNYDGDMLVDVYLDGEYGVTFRLNAPPKQMRIAIDGEQLQVHVLTQENVDHSGIVHIEPANVFTPHKVTVQKDGPGTIAVSNIQVH